jgi:hypothetical protein
MNEIQVSIDKSGLNFYSFNPRMVPDSVFSMPVMKKLKDRDPFEINKQDIKGRKK